MVICSMRRANCVFVRSSKQNEVFRHTYCYFQGAKLGISGKSTNICGVFLREGDVIFRSELKLLEYRVQLLEYRVQSTENRVQLPGGAVQG